jgi:hypothetical protein
MFSAPRITTRHHENLQFNPLLLVLEGFSARTGDKLRFLLIRSELITPSGFVHRSIFQATSIHSVNHSKALYATQFLRHLPLDSSLFERTSTPRFLLMGV